MPVWIQGRNAHVIAEALGRIIRVLQSAQFLESPRLVPVHRLQRLVAERVVDVHGEVAAVGAFVHETARCLAPLDGRGVETGVGGVEDDDCAMGGRS